MGSVLPVTLIVRVVSEDHKTNVLNANKGKNYWENQAVSMIVLMELCPKKALLIQTWFIVKNVLLSVTDVLETWITVKDVLKECSLMIVLV
jgi:hypothetical protein